jgi:hypothetical protein
MEIVTFAKNAQNLSLSFSVIDGVLSADYTIKIFRKSDQTEIFTCEGTNQHGDTFHELPSPIQQFDNCVIEVMLVYYGLDIAMSKKYKMGIIVFQNHEILKQVMVEGNLQSTVESKLIYFKLIMDSDE